MMVINILAAETINKATPTAHASFTTPSTCHGNINNKYYTQHANMSCDEILHVTGEVVEVVSIFSNTRTPYGYQTSMQPPLIILPNLFLELKNRRKSLHDCLQFQQAPL